jgi:RimJ/RimL family protein N-acetyltransferase
MLSLSDLRPTLIAGPIRLEPLTEAHRAGLATAANHEQIWAHMPSRATGDAFDFWFDRALDLALTGREAVWAVRTTADGVLAGSTRYLAIEEAHRRLEIGHTWYAPQVWGTRVNPACKLALLRYAFDSLEFNRVELKTDSRNLRSQGAIAKLGATREGVFRAHVIRADGSLRDSVYFSIVRDEWPAVRARLTARLATAAIQAAE